MTKINNGGSAFPHESYDPDADMDTVKSGMSLRDYFAAKALPLLGGRSWDHLGRDSDLIEAWARSAYAIADAMIAQRSVQS